MSGARGRVASSMCVWAAFLGSRVWMADCEACLCGSGRARFDSCVERDASLGPSGGAVALRPHRFIAYGAVGWGAPDCHTTSGAAAIGRWLFAGNVQQRCMVAAVKCSVARDLAMVVHSLVSPCHVLPPIALPCSPRVVTKCRQCLFVLACHRSGMG